MTLSTPSASSAATPSASVSAALPKLMPGPGDEVSAVSSATTPRIPTRSPPTSTITLIAVERGEPVVAAHVGVAEDHRKLRALDEFQERLRPEVEFVIAHHHRVEADAVHEFQLRPARERREEQRALELVAGIDHDDVLARRHQLVAQRVDRGMQPRGPAEALAGGLVLGRTGRIVGVDRLQAAVEIIDVQDVERERACRQGGHGGGGESGRRAEQGTGLHGCNPPRK